MTSPKNQAGLPDTWSASAQMTYDKIRAEHPTMSSGSKAALYEACALLAAADAMQEVVDRDGLVVKGSAGQPVAHPLIPEIRQARVQALAALRAIGIGVDQSSASRAGAALVGHRHRGVRSLETR